MVDELTPKELADKLRAGPDAVVLLDVREPYERAAAVIQPSLHIPMAQVASRLSEIPRDKPLVVYCHGGTRSMMVAAYLEGKGYRGIANLAGGIDAWSVEVDPSVPRYD